MQYWTALLPHPKQHADGHLLRFFLLAILLVVAQCRSFAIVEDSVHY